MMKAIIFLFLLYTTCGSAQSYTVEYSVSLNDPSIKWGSTEFYHLVLHSDGEHSVEYRKHKDTVIVNTTGIITETSLFKDQDSIELVRHKNIKEKIIDYKELSGRALVKDTLNIQYKIDPEKKTVLGYNCDKLIFQFRGRYYEAYYTKDIPIADGPFKFIGAPGLILEVESFDKSVVILPQAIHFEKNAEKTKFDSKDWMSHVEFIITYNQYVRHTLKTWYAIIAKNESENPGVTSSFNSRRIEVLPNKLDPEFDE